MISSIKDWWAPLGLLLAVLTPIGTSIRDSGDMRGAIKAQEQHLSQVDRRIDQSEQAGKDLQIDVRDLGRQNARMEAKMDLLLQRLPERP